MSGSDAHLCAPCGKAPCCGVGCGLRAVALAAGERHLSRTVVEHLPGGGVRRHPLSQVAMESGGRVGITPFGGERHSTLYHDRPLHLWRSCAPPLLCEEA